MGDLVGWQVLLSRFPPTPEPELDPILDAARECLLRRGIAKTTMTDIAKRAGIARSTLYRHVSSVDQTSLLIAIRECHRFLDAQPDEGVDSPERLITFIADFVRWVQDHALLDSLRDERDLIGDYALRRTQSSFNLLGGLVGELLRPLIDADLIRHHDPIELGEWVVRIVITLIVAPPTGDVAPLLRHLLLPALLPE